MLESPQIIHSILAGLEGRQSADFTCAARHWGGCNIAPSSPWDVTSRVSFQLIVCRWSIISGEALQGVNACETPALANCLHSLQGDMMGKRGNNKTKH